MPPLLWSASGRGLAGPPIGDSECREKAWVRFIHLPTWTADIENSRAKNGNKRQNISAKVISQGRGGIGVNAPVAPGSMSESFISLTVRSPCSLSGDQMVKIDSRLV